MMRDTFGRNLPPLSHKNSMDRLFGIIEQPTENVAWLDNINFAALHEKWEAQVSLDNLMCDYTDDAVDFHLGEAA